MNNNLPNLIAAVVLSLGIILGWQFFYEKPKLQKIAEQNKVLETQNITAQQQKEQIIDTQLPKVITAARIKIDSELLSGSISLKGLRLDDLILRKYKKDLSKDSDDVKLFSHTETEDAYFAEFGWLSPLQNITLPNSDTIWQTDNTLLSPGKPVTLSWVNKEGIKFYVTISISDDYLFTISQTIDNYSTHQISIQTYGLVNRKYTAKEKAVSILHQGPISVIDGNLKEYSYDSIKDKKTIHFETSKIDWIGITDKYWLTAIVPNKKSQYSGNFSYEIKDGSDRFQADAISQIINIEPGAQYNTSYQLFAGAKKVDLLDKYENKYDIKLFDRAIDFGWFYVITKPVFFAMNFFYNYVGNFGISILIVTVIVKLLMFTLANKSYRSMKRMKDLQPEIERIKTLYGNDKVRLNQEIMNLYKREKVNPVAGCLPILVQIPVFFSIYKVLYVTIEMRHAPFFGWIHDLSAPDPTSIFNLFGLLPFTPPSFLMIGAWPIIMAITMFLQQRMTPEPADPTQAMVMRFMPLIFLVMFSSFPAGLLIYWSWNNILSILQQYCINKLDR